jgi:adenosylmethionine-8-amino-7-oxononanoate aminotransferase
MPPVAEALQRLETELTTALNKKIPTLKLIHGYGSTGAGGDIRIAVQKRLMEMVQTGRIRACIFGEDWSKSDERAWRLVQNNLQLKDDPDLGRRNRGITIVVL